MTASDPRKIARIYAILDQPNVHDHSNFKTIVFSDTILTYNPAVAESEEERSRIVWNMCEFAEDLHQRLIGQDIWFRAILTSGDFHHYHLDHIQCFFGHSLIEAYNSEKKLPMIGLAIHRSCLEYNEFFRTEEFGGEYSFVFLARQLETLQKVVEPGSYPSSERIVTDAAPDIPEAVRFLSDLYRHMRSEKDPAVRSKSLASWDFYARRYPKLIAALVSSKFSLSALAPPDGWASASETLERRINYYKRIGAGTQLSLSLTNPARKGKRLRKIVSSNG